jgi:hypothetical protein
LIRFDYTPINAHAVDTPIIRRTVDELEAQNGKVHQRNEDLLSAELHQLPGPGIHVHSLEGFRERERLGERSGERDQEREPLERNGERDPKRLKIRDTCASSALGLWKRCRWRVGGN